MADNRSLTPLSEDDFEAIEAAVVETARGRWFLSEYARRNRNSDTDMLLAAIQRLETAVSEERMSQQFERIRFDLIEMAKVIAQLKVEIASDNAEHNHFEQATEALDAVVKTTEGATSSILESAEQIQEMAWTLREAGADPATCDTLDRRAADIYTACAFQDLTAQRTQKVVRTLRQIEGRINALVDAWASGDAIEPEKAPVQRPGQDTTRSLSQDDIDVVIVTDMGDDDVPPRTVPTAPAPQPSAGTGLREATPRPWPAPPAQQQPMPQTRVSLAEALAVPGAQETSGGSSSSGPSLSDIEAMPTAARLNFFG